MALSAFPISGGPIGSTGGPTGLPPSPSVGPSHLFNEQEVKYRYGERYISEATDKKFLAIPRGVYFGFVPTYASNVLTLAVDQTYGVSMGRVTSQDDSLIALDVLTETSAALDFSGHTTFPVNVGLRANGAFGLPHSAEIFTSVAAPTDPQEILLCVVTYTLAYTNLTNGPFEVGEPVVGVPSGSLATVLGLGENTLGVDVPSSFASGDTLTGVTSGATAELTAIPTIGVIYDAPTNRSTPFAYASAPLGYGFMPAGSVEDLLAAVSVVSEVENARVDLTGFTHPNLKARLDTDAAGPAIADRLGKEIRTIISEDYTLPAVGTGLNVSSSFSALYRTNSPVTDIQGFASETRLGAITDGTVPVPAPTGALADDERNVCSVIDTATERRVQGTDFTIAYGRLSFDEIALTGSLTWVATSDIVSGAGTLFPSQVEVGDIVEDPVGDYYAVEAIPASTANELLATIGGAPAAHDLSTTPLSNQTSVDPGTISITVDTVANGVQVITDDGAGNLTNVLALAAPGTVNYNSGTMTGVTLSLVAASTVEADYDTVDDEIKLNIVAANSGAQAAPLRRRFELSFVSRTGIATEGAVTVAGGTTIRFFFPVWSSMETAQFDYLTFLFRNSEPAPVIDATLSDSGRALVNHDTVTGKAGSINEVRDTGIPIGDGDFHTINFLGVADAGSGVANVSQRGETGDQGNPGTGGIPGPAGPKGPTGDGLERSGVYYQSVAVFQGFPWTTPGTTWTDTHDFNSTDSISEILFATTGLSRWQPLSNFSDDRFELALYEKISSTTVRVTGFIPTGGPAAYVRYLFNAAGLD